MTEKYVISGIQHEIIFDKPKSTINRQLFLERVVDWHEDGAHIQKILHDFDNQYRKKICAKCSLEQQQQRKCVRIDMYTNEGIQITSCRNMDNARIKKHSTLIRNFIQSNPALNLT